MLGAWFVLELSQSIGEGNGTKLMWHRAHYIHISTYLLLHVVLFFYDSALLFVVAKERYQMNAGSYLVTLLISCGPVLPCGCCGVCVCVPVLLPLRQQCTHTG